MGTLVSSNYNTAIGNLSAYSLTSGTQNTSIGYQTGGYMTTGSNNVSIGYLSGVSPSAPTLSDTIAIGKQITAVATGDMILGFTNFTPPNDYWVKFTPNTTFGGVQLQSTYNGSQNFTIQTNGNSVSLEGTFIDLNGTGSGAISGVNVSNGMNINTGVVQTTDKASNPTFQSLYSCFYSLSGVPYFGYNNAGTYTYSQLLTSVAPSTNILATYTSNPCDTSISPVGWVFDTIIPNTLGNQFSFIIYSNTAPTTTNVPYFTNNILTANDVADYILAVGTAKLIPYQYSNNGSPPVITNTSGYLFTAPTSIGALRFSSVVINPTSTGTTYIINATETTQNPITNGSTLTLVAYNSYF